MSGPPDPQDRLLVVEVLERLADLPEVLRDDVTRRAEHRLAMLAGAAGSVPAAVARVRALGRSAADEPEAAEEATWLVVLLGDPLHVGDVVVPGLGWGEAADHVELSGGGVERAAGSLVVERVERVDPGGRP